MTTRSAGSLVLGLALLVQGCAGIVASRPTPPPPAPPAPLSFGRGSFSVDKGRPGLVIGAPHGTSDGDTDLVGLGLARLTRWSVVVARGFSHLDPSGRRLNVNRPTESVPGDPPRLESESREAREAYEAYRAHVLAAAQGPLRLYVEVHGNGRRDSADRIEIATLGITPGDAWRLKTLLELVRDAHLASRPGLPRLEVFVEPLDRLHYTASAAKQAGLLRLAERAVHMELPRVARTTHREVYTALLADFLAQAAGLLLAAGR